MTVSLLLVALLVPSAPAVKSNKPPGPAPKIVAVAAPKDGSVVVLVTEPRTVQETYSVSVIENGVAVVQNRTRDVTVIESKYVSLADAGVTFRTAGDKALSAKEAAEKLKDGGHLIVPADREPIEPMYLATFAPDAVVAVYAKDGKLTLASPPAVPPAPTVVAIKADDKGVLNVPARGNREVIVKVPVAKEGDGVTKIEYIASKQTVEDLVPTPFDTVKPDAATADGKAVSLDEARKKLVSGAIVLVSTDGKPVDERYRKLVKPDTLVLSSAAMVHPHYRGPETRPTANGAIVDR